MNLKKFEVSYRASKQAMEARVRLNDFNIEDEWTGGIEKMMIKLND